MKRLLTYGVVGLQLMAATRQYEGIKVKAEIEEPRTELRG